MTAVNNNTAMINRSPHITNIQSDFSSRRYNHILFIYNVKGHLFIDFKHLPSMCHGHLIAAAYADEFILKITVTISLVF